ncbi:hypothetical protein [Flavobacterium sp. KACC 22763]|uniref:hypothetical protein n=1 Tax=Flavobacterium sp. KACC 22763 TaxID=3025668 RepID=UPI002365BF2A|nr:hypothetical protein [Flavobacterium sp. KACC 22763]WDF65469.1 hypothetical protein PQ463_04740 [Flavobacterium sp. KACC 22763]
MNAEFNSRVDLQRQVLKIVNSKSFKMQLSGLSKPALENWIMINSISNNELKNILFKISELLFFIANRSQDQITEEYKKIQLKAGNEIGKLKVLLN